MSRSRARALTGAALVAALVLTGCGPDETDDGGGGDNGSGASAPRSKLLNRVPMAKVSKMATAQGMWTTKRNFAKANFKKIVGHPLDGGKPRWTVPLGGDICWTSPETAKGRFIAVVFENDKADPSVCTEVGLVDLERGKMVWQKQAQEDGSAQMFDEVTIGGGTVAAGGTSGTAGWTLGGRPLWTPNRDEQCPARAYAGSDTKMIAVRDCGDDPDFPRLRVETVNPKTRAVKSAYSLPSETRYAHVVSTDPLVLALDDGKAKGGSGVTQFVAVDDSTKHGKPLGTISTAGGGKHGKYNLACPATDVTDCQQVAVSKEAGKLFLSTQDPLDKDSDARNDIVAFDLRTGRRSGTTEGSEGGELTPIGLDEGGKVLAYEKADRYEQQGGAVWQIDPATHKKKQILQNPSGSYELEENFEIGDTRIAYANKRLYLGSDEVSEPSPTMKGQPLAVVFGAK